MQAQQFFRQSLLGLLTGLFSVSIQADPAILTTGDSLLEAEIEAIQAFTISPNPAVAGNRLEFELRFDVSAGGTNRLCLYYPIIMGPLTGFADQTRSGLQDLYTHTAALGPGSAAGNCPLQANFYAHQWVTPNVSFLAQGGDILTVSANLRDDISGLFTLSFLQTGGSGGILNAFLTVDAAASPPSLLISPETVSFGRQTVGETSSPQPLQLENDGGSDLNITGIQDISPNFSVNEDSCGALPIRLSPGASCTLMLSFTPDALGLAITEIVIESDAPGSPDTAELRGTGVSDPLFADRFDELPEPPDLAPNETP